MPAEVLLTIAPPLEITSENFSEMETTSAGSAMTDRSSSSQNSNRQPEVNKRKLCIGYPGKNKMRKSAGMRLQKKTPLKVNSQHKSTSALQLKSHIPRALLLTPSSSSTSLATNDSLSSPLLPIRRTPLEEKPLTANEKALTSTLVREKSAIILAFRKRKSISQMDFNQARRNMRLPISPTALMPCAYGENTMVPNNQNSFVHKMFKQDSYYYTMHERDPHMAGFRIFAKIMLNAWRKRRDEVKNLLEDVTDLKRGAIRTKNQLHVFNTLYRVEQKRNDELNCQLKRSLEDINITKSSCESLTTSLISLKADKALLEQQFQIKEQEFESLNTLLTQTKSDFFKSLSIQRELQANLSIEQRKVQALENQKNDLINEICELNNEASQKEQALNDEILAKTLDNEKVKHDLQDLHEKINLLSRSKERDCRDSSAREERMKKEIEALENELKALHKCLENSFGTRLKNCWHNTMTYQKFTLQMLHWLAFYVLPATPPPPMNSLPFNMSLDKALSIVKR